MEIHQRSKEEILSRVGNLEQLTGFRRFQLIDGKGKSNEIIQVRNGSGLQFDINKDRSFDLGLCEYFGIPISWLSPNGSVAPYYYDKEGKEWERSFSGGLLTTCGLTYMGKPSTDEGIDLGIHGRISSTPGTVLQSEGYWENDDYYFVFRGLVRESTALGENVVLERRITTKFGSNELHIKDKITNEAFLPVEHQVLYHFNFGYPLVSETMSIQIPSKKKRWINGDGELNSYDRFQKPSPNVTPTVMLHEALESDSNGDVEIIVKNDVLHNGTLKKLKVQLSYDGNACPYLTQWKHQGSGKYVLGMEPGNTTTEGRGFHRKQNTLPFLQPHEVKEYSFKITFDLLEDN